MPIEEVPFQEIVGDQLSSVEFVQDYVQLQFDGPALTAVTHPVVESDGKELLLGSVRVSR